MGNNTSGKENDAVFARFLVGLVTKYEKPRLGASLWQIVNTIVPYAIVWYLMFVSLQVSYWLTLALAILAGGFLVRVFIIFHDCVHGAFFKSLWANQLLGGYYRGYYSYCLCSLAGGTQSTSHVIRKS
jgi:fatty acid desaturase